MSSLNQITLSWWNTSLSPLGKDREKPSDLTVFNAVIDHLIYTQGVDLCVLGEVSEANVEDLRNHVRGTNYEVSSAIESIGRSTFSTCLLFDSEKFSCRALGNEILLQEQSKYRIAQHIALVTNDLSTVFQIFISHWPSRLNLAQNAPLRLTFGDRLRQRVNKIFEESELSNVILLGDYNDEPFDASLSEGLRATRDKDLIKKKPALLYNPFWRHLCHPDLGLPSDESRSKQESWGSYFHHNGQLFKRRTFDQMFFSSSFLGRGDWNLNEAKTLIVDFEPYTQLVTDRNVSFDHLPIVATLERKKND